MNKRHSLAAWAAGTIVLVGAPVAQADPKDPVTDSGHMGLSREAWQEYRAGERAAASDAGAPGGAGGHMGLSVEAWHEYRAGERAS